MLIKTGIAVSQMSGTMGGVVASHNRYGQYFRAWRKPTDPSTARQQAIRTHMGVAVAFWRALTQAHKETWNSYANNTPWTNKLGEAVILTGMQMFIRSQVSKLIAADFLGDAAVSLAACTSAGGLPQQLGTGGNASTLTVIAGLSLGYDDTAGALGSAGGFGLIYMSEPRPVSQKFDGKPRRLVSVLEGAVVPPASPLVVATASLPWPIIATQRSTIYARLLSVDGRLSQETPFELVVA